ncbi:hypothetical protein L0F63_002097 [Massospora cicadina]|nr:hypothetical protein L0F63_002097 [Massospora cicadina]
MGLVHLALILGGLLVTTLAQSEDEGDDSVATEEPGEAANTDATQFAGVYSFIYYSNTNTSAGLTAQLPCNNSTEFQLTIPEGEGSDVERNVEGGGKDPVYLTSQGSWTIMEVGKGNGFNVLKMNLYYDDEEEMIVCWALKKAGKNILANVNPRNFTQCPTKYVPIFDTCTRSRATLVGTCLSGPCTGEKSTESEDSSSSLLRPLPYFLALSPLALLI